MVQFEISLFREHQSFLANEGDTLLDALLEGGFSLPHECGGNCACTTCRIAVLEGMEYLSPMEEPERDRLELEGCYAPHVRLACQAILRTERGKGELAKLHLVIAYNEGEGIKF